MTVEAPTNPDARLRTREANRVELRAQSLDQSARTVDAILTTERMVSFGFFAESLLMDGARYSASHPMLDAHSRESFRSVLGSVVNIRRENDKLVGTLRFASGADADDAMELIRDGHLTDVSVGYSIEDEVKIPRGTKAVVLNREFAAPADKDLYVVTDWQLKEVSLVPIGADSAAKLRAESQHKLQESPRRAIGESTEGGAPIMETTETPGGHPATTPKGETLTERIAQAATPAIEQLDANALRAEGEKRVRERTATIRELCTLAGVTGERALEYIASDESVDAIRAKLVAERAAKAKPVSVEITRDERDTFRAGAVAGLRLRANQRVSDAEREMGRQYAGLTLLELAQQSLRAAGQPIPMGRENVLRAAMAGRPRINGDSLRAYNHTTSDFPLILADALNKSLQDGYTSAAVTYPLWTRTVSISDFKARKVNKLSEAPDLLEVGENAEIPEGVLAEDKEEYSLKTYARIISITRQTLINDDLDAFTRIPTMLGAAARRTIQKSVSFVLNEGNQSTVVMSDSDELFDTNHGNYATTSSALAEATLAAGLAAMQNQTGLTGERIGVLPRFLIVPPGATHFTARKLIESTGSTAASGNSGITNPAQGLAQVIVDPFLGDATANGTTAWYLAADNSSIDTVEVGFLNGVDAPTIEEDEAPFEVLGMKIRAFIDYGVKAIDWRGLYKATGQ